MTQDRGDPSSKRPSLPKDLLPSRERSVAKREPTNAKESVRFGEIPAHMTAAALDKRNVSVQNRMYLALESFPQFLDDFLQSPIRIDWTAGQISSILQNRIPSHYWRTRGLSHHLNALEGSLWYLVQPSGFWPHTWGFAYDLYVVDDTRFRRRPTEAA